MGVDIESEVMKAADRLNYYGIPREDQLNIVRWLMGAGVEHCLNEQEKLRVDKDHLLRKAYPGLSH